MPEGDRHGWSRIVSQQQGRHCLTTTATPVARDHRIRPVSLDSLASRCHSTQSGAARG